MAGHPAFLAPEWHLLPPLAGYTWLSSFVPFLRYRLPLTPSPLADQARDPIDRIISLLTTHFRADAPSDPAAAAAHASLAICSGAAGARLTHSHERQYAFVLQSLTLWREIANDMFRLWCLAEEDLLRSDNGYEQRDTGQGVQRVQEAPRTKRAMAQLLHMTQVSCAGPNGWAAGSGRGGR